MPESLAHVVDRLRGEFTEVSPNKIVTMVRRCHEDIDIAPPAAMPELVERLARHRLRADVRASAHAVSPGVRG